MTLYDIMVYYDPRQMAPTIPPVCPKCGSHRTEIIGVTDTPPTLVLRCSKCGALSTVPIEERDSRERIA